MARFVVTRAPGRTWDHAVSTREQAGWDEHAAFMDGLADEGFVLLGGPVGDGTRVLLIVDSREEDAIHVRLAVDPWTRTRLLRTVDIRRWNILLDADRDRGGDYHVVELAHGPGWDDAKLRREQLGWDAHARFMDALTDEGVVVLGGPVGDGDGDGALLVVDLDGESAVRARLAADPWAGDVLTIETVEPRSVWLHAPVRRKLGR